MKRKSVLIAFVALFVFGSAVAQSDSSDVMDLEAQYIELKAKSNNYQIYKVVKEASMDQFWNSVADTLLMNSREIQGLNKTVGDLNAQVKSLQGQVAEKDQSMSDQAYQVEHMSFLGMDITKSSYIVLSWSIIFVLIAIALVLFFRFKNANKVTSETKSEFQALSEEFEAHKQKARENETKLKRDLQTEINLVEELKEKLG